MEKKTAWMIVSGFLIVFIVFGFGFIIAKSGGIVDGYIIEKGDKYNVMREKVAKEAPGLEIGDELVFPIKFRGHITDRDILQIKKLTDELEDFFYPFPVQSLATAKNYKIIINADGEEEDVSKPYINDELIAKIKKGEPWDIASWKKDIERDDNARDIFMGKNYDYAQIIVFLPQGYDENEIRDKTAEFLEKKKTNKWLWYIFKDNIEPIKELANVFVSGWPIARPLMTAGLLKSLLTLSIIGIMISAGYAFFVLGSYRQVVIIITVLVYGLVVARGSIGLLQVLATYSDMFLFFGEPIAERVYLTLVFTAVIIASNSFSLKEIETYNEIRAKGFSVQEAWKRTKVIHGSIFLILIITVYDFASQYQIGIRGLMEIGFLSVIALVFLYLLTIYFIPALHTVIGGDAGENYRPKVFTWEKIANTIIGRCYVSVIHYSPRKTFVLATTLVLGLFLSVSALIASDYLLPKKSKYIEARTKPIEYMYGTIVYEVSKFLNKPGNFGFGISKATLLPQEGKSVEDPEFIRLVDEFKKAVEKIPEVRYAKIITSSSGLIAKRDYGTQLPETRQQAHDTLDSISYDLGPIQKKHYWSDEAFVLFISHDGKDSVEMNSMNEAILALAQTEKFATIMKVYLPDKVSAYARGDAYIIANFLPNLFNSWAFAFVACFLWLWYVNLAFSGQATVYTLHPLKGALLIMVPFVFSASVIALIMMLWRIPLDQATACINPLSLNAALDFNIYLVADYHLALLTGKTPEEALKYALRDKGKLILLDCIINAICFLPLNGSPFIPIQRMGILMAVMLFFNGFGALVIMPAMLSWAVSVRKVKRILFFEKIYQRIISFFPAIKRRQDLVFDYYTNS